MSRQFTGRSRRKETHWSVRLADRLSSAVITVGGVGTILAVSTVFFYLLYVALPLFRSAQTRESGRIPGPAPHAAEPLWMQTDEFGQMVALLGADGRLASIRLQDGKTVSAQNLSATAALSAFCISPQTSEALCGFTNGLLRTGRAAFAASYPDARDLPPALQHLRAGESAEWQGGLVQRLSGEQFRAAHLTAEFDEPFPGPFPAPVFRLDQTVGPAGRMAAVLGADGSLALLKFTRRENLLTGQVTLRRTAFEIPYARPGRSAPPSWMILSELGDTICLAWPDGTLLRLDIRDPSAPEPLEQIDLVPEPGRRLTALEPLLGRTTLLAGDSSGCIRTWFPAFPPDRPARKTLVSARSFQGPSAVRSLASSTRMRLFSAGYEDGTVDWFHVTAGKHLARLRAGERPVQRVAASPKDDLLLALDPSHLAVWRVDAGHPEVTPASLFLPVWYESASRPEHVWQSSSGTDDFEPKLGLLPLIFGTLKATVFSMLFGVPIALLAAVFTSEFLSPRAKLRIKPAVEMMAGLPSVVLGFLAALVLAPMAAARLPELLAGFFTVPVAFLCGAVLWQLLPQRWTIRLTWLRLPLLLAAVPAGLLAAGAIGPFCERMLFAGDLMRWLDGQIGAAFGGWLLLLLPPAGLLTAWFYSAVADPRLRARAAEWSRFRCAAADLLKTAAGLLAALALASGAAWLLQRSGWDPRGGLLSTYVQRNALIVGLVMGFAIIPIVYTLSEDALSSVPDHLRSASLGAGATPWQTAVRIVIPSAMSGLFSAVMVGLGRAVGETMIVLMAAGNTPVMEWNLFNGFRTLSANIAVELPEAVRNSTHYRTLFLAALVLFIFTFVLNTLAELVRARFRKKGAQL